MIRKRSKAKNRAIESPPEFQQFFPKYVPGLFFLLVVNGDHDFRASELEHPIDEKQANESSNKTKPGIPFPRA